MALKDSILKLQDRALSIKIDLALKIQALPDNPVIKRIESQPNCFTIMSSELSKDLILDPCYYDFKYQYRHLIIKIEKTEILELDKTMQTIIEKGTFTLPQGTNRHGQRCSDTIKLHPDVINYLKTVVEDANT